MWKALSNMFSIKELRERIIFTLLMLGVYRLAGSIWCCIKRCCDVNDFRYGPRSCSL